jgi:signal transduction histidine kinase
MNRWPRSGHRADLECARDAPWHGDERLLFEAVSNLVENAIKFTPDGGG